MIHRPVDEVKNSHAGPFVVLAVVCTEPWNASERSQLGGDVVSNSMRADGNANLTGWEEGDLRDLGSGSFQLC